MTLTHSEHVTCDILTPLTLSSGSLSEVKSGILFGFNIELEHFNTSGNQTLVQTPRCHEPSI